MPLSLGRMCLLKQSNKQVCSDQDRSGNCQGSGATHCSPIALDPQLTAICAPITTLVNALIAHISARFYCPV